MIVYDNRDFAGLIFRRSGSLLFSYNVILPTLLSSALSVVVFQFPSPLSLPTHLEWPAWVYSTVLTFAIIFRTALAYSRFWKAIQSSVSMLSLWRGAYVNLNAFVDASIVEHQMRGNQNMVEELLESKARLLHWFSLLFAVSIQTLQWREDPDPLRAMSQNEIDDMGQRRFWAPWHDLESCERIYILDNTSRREREQLEAAFDKLTKMVHWIEYEVSYIHLFSRLLISSPILTRVYEDLSGGTLAYCQAHTIAFIPFPFLFAQVLSYALYVFVLLCPFIVQASLNESEIGLQEDAGSWAALVTMNVLLVAGFSCLNQIAVELEDPFREKDNNFPLRVLQRRVDWSIASVALNCSPRDFDLDHFGPETKLFQKRCEESAAEYALDHVAGQGGAAVAGPPATQRTVSACEDLRRSVTTCVQALERDSMHLWREMHRTELELCSLAFRVLACDGRSSSRQPQDFSYDSHDPVVSGLVDLPGVGHDRPPESCDVAAEHCPGRPPESVKAQGVQVVEFARNPASVEPARSRTELDLRALLRKSAAVNGKMAPLLMKAMCSQRQDYLGRQVMEGTISGWSVSESSSKAASL